MQKTWIDDEGRVRLRSEGNQFVFPGASPLDLDPWLSYDSWGIELAIKLIAIGYNVDIKRNWECAKDFPYGSTGWDSAREYVSVYQRGLSIAESSIAAGLLKNHDTPANWLAWAKRKGYNTDHLSPQTAIAKLESSIDGCENEGLLKNYTEQIESLKKLLAIIEPLQAEPQPQAGNDAPEVGTPASKNKTPETLAFEAEVNRLMTLFWNDRSAGTEPTKGELHTSVYNEMLRGKIRGKSGQLNIGMVRDAAKTWKKPLVLPSYVPPAKLADKRHPFKGER